MNTVKTKLKRSQKAMLEAKPAAEAESRQVARQVERQRSRQAVTKTQAGRRSGNGGSKRAEILWLQEYLRAVSQSGHQEAEWDMTSVFLLLLLLLLLLHTAFFSLSSFVFFLPRKASRVPLGKSVTAVTAPV